MLAGCTSPGEPAAPTPATSTTSVPSSSSDGSERAAAEQAAESSRLAAQEAARVAAEGVAARVAAEQEAARVEAEKAAAAQAAAAEEANRVAAEQAAADEAERAAEKEHAQFDAAVAAGSCTEAPTDRVDECVAIVEGQADAAAAENGWYAPNGQWISPGTEERALAAGIPAGGDVPGYLRCGTICGEDPTSGEVQSWNLGLEPVPPGYESWFAPNATPYAGEGQ